MSSVRSRGAWSQTAGGEEEARRVSAAGRAVIQRRKPMEVCGGMVRGRVYPAARKGRPPAVVTAWQREGPVTPAIGGQIRGGERRCGKYSMSEGAMVVGCKMLDWGGGIVG